MLELDELLAVLWMLLKAADGLLSKEEVDLEVWEEELSKGVDMRLASAVLAVLDVLRTVSAERWSLGV